MSQNQARSIPNGIRKSGGKNRDKKKRNARQEGLSAADSKLLR